MDKRQTNERRDDEEGGEGWGQERDDIAREKREGKGAGGE